MNTQDALTAFVERWFEKYKQNLPTITFDSQRPSLCYAEDAVDGHFCPWRPVEQAPSSDMFTRLSQALETDIHPDIVSYYTSFWSDHLSASSNEGDLVLLQVWNEEDMERLRANLIGHALAKHKQKHPLTFFFACTEPDDGILSINNYDGTVWLEYPGKKPVRQIDDNLSSFLARLTPQ